MPMPLVIEPLNVVLPPVPVISNALPVTCIQPSSPVPETALNRTSRFVF